MRLWVCLFLAILAGREVPGTRSSGSPAADEQKAIARLKQAVDLVTIGRDETKPGEPVIEVRLFGERATDAILPELRNFKSLRSLRLNDTSVSNEGLKILQDLPGLEEVGLRGEKFTDGAVEHLRGVKHLKSLGLCGSAFTDGSLVKLKGASTLRSLRLCETAVTDAGLAPLVELRELEELDLGGTPISGTGLRHLKPLKKLRTLDLRETKVTDENLQALHDLDALRSLNLAGTAITGEGLRQLAGLSKLEGLLLCCTKVNDDGLSHLKKLGRLKSLDLSGTAVMDAGLSHLKEMRSLEQVDLDDTDVTDKADADLEKALPKLAAGRANDRREWAERNKREQKDLTIPEADAKAILDAVILQVLTEADLQDTREAYGTKGDKRVGLVSDSPIKWPKDYVPSVKGYEFQYLAEARYPERNEVRKPALLGIRLDKLGLTWNKDDLLFGAPIHVTVSTVAGGRAIGGCSVFFSAEKKDGKWVVTCVGAFDA